MQVASFGACVFAEFGVTNLCLETARLHAVFAYVHNMDKCSAEERVKGSPDRPRTRCLSTGKTFRQMTDSHGYSKVCRCLPTVTLFDGSAPCQTDLIVAEGGVRPYSFSRVAA